LAFDGLLITGTNMPRKARIDAPGALHHIIMRGIERRKIFWDDADRDSFINRLGQVLTETQTDCFAWALIPNHVHLLLRTGLAPISTVMQMGERPNKGSRKDSGRRGFCENGAPNHI
jgi:hypothetical protein